ncbi:response regulator [Aliiglaciecola litoralis]|uniref:Response regulatory domain-containing protein n=1 Tax=Aliiglaciecola litoralis TaxID=582857 RepID=A0ABP3X2V1_9ALTE
MHNILVIDDDVITLELLQLILDEFIEGEVCTMSNSSEAIRYIEKDGLEGTDLVICDWQMPEHDGLEVLAAIRKKNQQVPFLLLTGNATRDLVIAARKAKVSDFIAKPFKNYDLTEKVKRLLDA